MKKPKKEKLKREKQQKRELITDHHASSASGICLVLSAVCMIVAIVMLARGPYKIKDYEIENGTDYPIETVSEAIGDLHGQSYLSIDFEAISADVIAKLPYVRSLEFDYSFPFHMTVRVLPEIPTYYYSGEDGVYVFTDELKLVEVKAAGSQCNLIKLVLPEDMTLEMKKAPSFELSITAEDMLALINDVAKIKPDSKFTLIDFSDPYYIKLIMDERYLICFGDLSEKKDKLEYVGIIFEECAPKLFSDRTLRIDVSVPGRKSYTLDAIFNH